MSGIIEKYLAKIREVTSRAGIYAYRGQEKAQWPLHSAATRRLVKERGDGILQAPGFPGLYTKYHLEELIEPARARGFDVERGHKISDLQLLAKLQHFGAATGLLDFTWSPLIALWFASQDPTCDGKLFVINTRDPIQMSKVLSNEGDQDAKTTFARGDDSQPLSLDLSYWEPMLSGDAMSRILRQRSVFIIGRPLIPEGTEIVREIEIAKEDKASLLEDLALLDISQLSLFQDVYGFAEANRATAPVRQIQDPDYYLLQGNQFYQQRDYPKAIDAYSTSIELEPLGHRVGLTYFLRGSAKALSGDYRRALEDYNEAVDRKESIPNAALFIVYLSRAHTCASLNEFRKAIADFNESLTLNPGFAEAYSGRGDVRLKLKQHGDAIADYDQAIRLNPNYVEAYYNRGNVYLELEQYGDAIVDYDQAIRLNPDLAEAYSNRGIAKAYLGRDNDALADQDQAISLNPNLAEVYGDRGITKALLNLKNEARKDLETALEMASDTSNANTIDRAEKALRLLDADESP